MMNKLIIIACLAVTLTISSTASATPEWRGNPGSTYQEWQFDSNDTDLDPDIFSNDYGTAHLKVYPHGDWIPDPGAWALSGEIDVQIPNLNEENPEKRIHIQLTWQPAYNDPLLPSEPIIGIVSYPLFEGMSMGPRIDTDDGEGWTYSTYDITIRPNPGVEWITIKGDILVDELVIDTICCIPEPATICLLGLGTLILLKKCRV